MTQYTVVWLRDARRELEELWVEARGKNDADRMALITRSAYRTDRELAHDPTTKATHLSEGLWRFDAAPLRIYFTVRSDDRVVEISNIVAGPD
jgi:plasmid stabilization system protein ParE